MVPKQINKEKTQNEQRIDEYYNKYFKDGKPIKRIPKKVFKEIIFRVKLGFQYNISVPEETLKKEIDMITAYSNKRIFKTYAMKKVMEALNDIYSVVKDKSLKRRLKKKTNELKRIIEMRRSLGVNVNIGFMGGEIFMAAFYARTVFSITKNLDKITEHLADYNNKIISAFPAKQQGLSKIIEEVEKLSSPGTNMEPLLGFMVLFFINAMSVYYFETYFNMPKNK